MKKLIAVKSANAKRLFIVFFTMILFQFAQISFSQTVIPVGASRTYTTITNAYTNIPAPLTGAYIIEIQSDYSAAGETTVTLTAKSGASASNYILICPAINVSKTIGLTDDFTVKFEGADYVTIDGTFRGGTSSLTLINSKTSGNTIIMINDASYNTIRNCTIKGRNTSTTSGVIVISTTTGTFGNKFNTFSNNKISADAANYPKNLMYSDGTTGKENSDNTISNNEFFNFTQNGIYVSNTGNGNNWTIGGNSPGTGNHFYQTFTSSTTQIPIFFKPGSTSQGNIIGYNYIGGGAVNCGGSAWTNSGIVPFVGIKANVSTSVSGLTIKNNTIQNFNFTSTSTSATFYGIYADSGSMIIDNNLIGHNSSANSIQSSAPALVCGIFSEALYTTYFTDNIIANITLTSTNYNAPKLRGIRHSQKIGDSRGKIYIQNNTVHDLKNAGTISWSDGTIYGIVYADSSRLSEGEISGNTVYNLFCTGTTGSNVYMGGIEIDEYAFNVNLFNNKIYGLSNTNATNPMIGGIIMHIDYITNANHNVNVYNNMVSLDNSQDAQLYGIWDIGVVSNTTYFNVYYNTVYLLGTVVSGNNQSACFDRGFTGATPSRLPTKTTTELRNNIFINSRTGGTGNHYSILNYVDNTSSPSTGWSQNSSNYNLLITASSSAVTGWGGMGVSFNDYTFDNWKISTGTTKQDSNSWYLTSSSVNLDNLFVNPSAGDLSINSANSEAWYAKGKGVAGSFSGFVNSDYFGNSRLTSFGYGTCLGAQEFTTSTVPPAPSISSSIAVGNTQIVTQSGKTLGAINWVSGSALPSAINFEYHSGTNPPGNATGNYGNCFWKVTQTGGTNYSYTITLNYEPAQMGTISGENYIRIAKSEDGINWSHYGLATVNTTNKTVSFTFSTFSYFTIDDQNFPMPVELASFTSSIESRNVLLKWQTNNETNNSGFDIQRNNNNEWKSIAFVEGKNSELNKYSFADNNLKSGTYKYRLKQIDYNGNYRYYDLTNAVTIGTPSKFDLSQNYPNPFNPVTKINYNLPVNSRVTLKVYDIAGKEVAVLVNDFQVSGYYDIEFSSSKYNLSSGVYFYKIQVEDPTGRAGDFVSVKRMLLIK